MVLGGGGGASARQEQLYVSRTSEKKKKIPSLVKIGAAVRKPVLFVVRRHARTHNTRETAAPARVGGGGDGRTDGTQQQRPPRGSESPTAVDRRTKTCVFTYAARYFSTGPTTCVLCAVARSVVSHRDRNIIIPNNCTCCIRWSFLRFSPFIFSRSEWTASRTR